MFSTLSTAMPLKVYGSYRRIVLAQTPRHHSYCLLLSEWFRGPSRQKKSPLQTYRTDTSTFGLRSRVSNQLISGSNTQISIQSWVNKCFTSLFSNACGRLLLILILLSTLQLPYTLKYLYFQGIIY